MEKNKKNRATLRSAATRMMNAIDDILKNDIIDFDLLEENLNLLQIKAQDLENVDNLILNEVALENYDAELDTSYEYKDRISTTVFRVSKKLKDNKSSVNIPVHTNVENIEQNLNSENTRNIVKLPKLIIQKFYGDCTQFHSFWNTFQTAIHENNYLTKIEKFNYLKGYLAGSAAQAIEGFEINESNYDSAVKILENRYGNKQVIINNHMNKLLNLSPVYKSNDISRLKKLHNEIEVNIRSLSALGVESQSYSSMLVAVILKIIPGEFSLEYNRKNVNKELNPDINDLLDFIQSEIECREQTFFKTKIATDTQTDSNKNKFKAPNHKLQGNNTTCEFLTAVNGKSSDYLCFFCNSKDHRAEACDGIGVDKKKETLKKLGKCFRCLKSKHRIKECRSNITCKLCSGIHNQTICYKLNSLNENKTSEPVAKETETPDNVLSAISYNNKNKILLQTCTVKVENNCKEIVSRLLCDCGSMRSFLTQKLSDSLGLPVIRKEKLSVYTFGNKNPIEKMYDVVKLTLKNKDSPNLKIIIEALVTDEISGSNIPPPELEDIPYTRKLENLILADSPDSQEPITLLIGADYYYNVVTGKIKHLSKKLVAVETIFGWCLQGRNSENQTSLALSVVVQENVISDQLKKFWDLETSGLIDTKLELNFTENQTMKNFESNIKYDNSSKRYEVGLPWKSDERRLEDNKTVAENRFTKLRKRFIRNPELYFEYSKVLEDYLQQGIIEVVKNPEIKRYVTFYLPHREIIREDRITSKLRIVFDASSHDFDSPSLNDCLSVGPNLYPEVFDILLLFRLNPIAFTTDMKQAFLQIGIEEKDRDVCRFLFTDDPFDESKPLLTYRFTRVLFGVCSSPFLLAATIKHHLKKYSEKYPETVDFLNKNIYVDDIIGSHCSVEKALSVSLQSIEILEEASLNLHKWHTNSQPLRRLWEEKGIISDDNPETFGEENLPYKVLGIAWNSVDDLLYFDVKGLINFVAKRTDTKRFILQVLGRIFDPIGFLGPFTLRIKILMQKVWSLGLNWDDKLPEDLSSLWKNWCDEITQLLNFSVPRYYFFEILNKNIDEFELHLFSDSSTKAYGTVAYLRVTTADKDVRTVFVASKNRVAPLKTLTLPRLELMAALLSAKLSSNVLKALNLNISCHFWTDSKITYFWIKGLPEKFKPFIRNRVEEIHNLTSPSNWHHCPGIENPADMVSRGTKIDKLLNNEIWLQGPKWLRLSPEFWPKSEDIDTVNVYELEYKKKSSEVFQCECVVQKSENVIDITKYSNFEKLVRVLAWVKKFIKKMKKSTEVSNNTLTAEELLEAENFLILHEQKTFFADEIESLTHEKTINKNSSLNSFIPYLDDKRLMRLGGRLEFSDLQLEEKHPIILPKKSWLTTLIVRHEHEKIMHSGVAATLTKIRSKYWIPKGRQLVKSIIKKCIVCKKYLSKPADQITAPLPHDRASQAPPFSVCGLDFAGPLYVKNFKEIQKSYVVLFTCGITRSVHLEHVSDMTTDSFLLAFRRFIARRGNCKIIYSDNAKQFKKSKTEIENFSKILSDNVFLKFIAKERIVWKNIIERAAWWGGFYERLVKSVKDCLRKIVGKALLSFEEMTTLLAEVEAVLNMRPLTYVYDENNEPQPLTPSHFLNFGKEPTCPITFAEVLETGSKKSSFVKRKKYQSLLLKQLWKRWKEQYLMDLKTSHALKNPNTQKELKVGEVVLIEGDNKNKLLWKLGKIEKAIIGRDGNIRSYEIKTANGLLKRSVQHLYPLEL